MYEYWKQRLQGDALRQYHEIYTALCAHRTSAPCLLRDTDTLRAIYTAIVDDHPELYDAAPTFGVRSSAFRATIQLSYLFDPYAKGALERTARDFEARMRAKKSLPPLEAEKEVLTELVMQCTYEIDMMRNQNAMAALHFKKAQCSGFASAFKWAMDLLQIPCLRVDGEAKDRGETAYTPHSWNMIQLDGVFYHVCPTTMVGSNPQKTQPLFFACVNCSDQFMKNEGFRWDERQTPSCPKDLPFPLPTHSQPQRQTTYANGNQRPAQTMPQQQSRTAAPPRPTDPNAKTFTRLFEVHSFVQGALEKKTRSFSVVLDISQYPPDKLGNMLMQIVTDKAKALRLHLQCQITMQGNHYTVSLTYM